MESNMLKSPLIILHEGQFGRLEFTVKSLGDQDAILKKIAARAPVTVLDAFNVGEVRFGIQLSGPAISSWCLLPYLQMSSVFNMTTDGMVYPVFKAKVTPGTTEFEASFKWDPAIIGMRLYFVTAVALNPSGGGGYIANTAYLVARSNDSKANLRPPLPNIYNDCRICMGSSFQCVKPTIKEVAEYSLNHFFGSRWNADLLDTPQEAIMALFRWKDGKQQAPHKDMVWHRDIKSVYPVNNSGFSELPIQ